MLNGCAKGLNFLYFSEAPKLTWQNIDPCQPLVKQPPAGPIEATNKHIDSYALVGLRTLALAVRELGQEEVEAFSRQLATAQQTIEVRQLCSDWSIVPALSCDWL